MDDRDRAINRNGLRRPLAILNLGNPSFKTHFRMSKVIFERLVQVVGRFMTEGNLIRRLRTPVDESVLMGVWVLFNVDTFRSEGLNFAASTSKIQRHYKRLLWAMVGVGHRFIKWPTARDRARTATFFERLFGFTGAVLLIDGTLIQITAPSEQKQRYVDRHHNYSLNVQIVSDHRRLIRDVYIGQPGSVNDARVFRRSPLAKFLYSRNDMLNANKHILGDSAYSNTTKVLTPYRDFGNLTDSHRNYNHRLSQCRATVERLNALLKARMARLRRLFCKQIETTNLHIAASCVLHNFILLAGEDIDGLELDGAIPNIDVQAAIDALEAEGMAKRRDIRFQLENIDDD